MPPLQKGESSVYDVVILAGGTLEKEFSSYFDVSHKSFIPICGKMMLEYVIDTLQDVPSLGRKVLVSSGTGLPDIIREKVDLCAESGSNIMESVKSGVDALTASGSFSSDSRVLLVPCDVPLLTGKAVIDFLTGCEMRGAPLCYSFLSRQASEEKYPGLHHTYARLREGVFCGGSLVLLAPSILEKCSAFFTRITGARKKPLEIASILGLKVIVKFLTFTLSVADLEERISRLIGIQAVGIESPHAEISFNVDELSTLTRAVEILNGDRLEY